jgi:hypothetical protein
MHEKAWRSCRVLAALAALAACAISPTVSSASPVATQPTGTKLATGTNIKATLVNGNALLKDTSGNTVWTCSSATLTGTLTENSGTSIRGNITSAVIGGTGPQAPGEPAPECTVSTGNFSYTTGASTKTPWCLQTTSATLDTWSLSGGGCPGGGALTFTLVSTTIGTCEYASTKAVAGTYTTDSTGDAILTVTESGFKQTNSNVFCGTSFTLSEAFTLEKDSATAEPIYIS